MRQVSLFSFSLIFTTSVTYTAAPAATGILTRIISYVAPSLVPATVVVVSPPQNWLTKDAPPIVVTPFPYKKECVDVESLRSTMRERSDSSTTGPSVNTDAGSVFNLVKDVGNVIFGNDAPADNARSREERRRDERLMAESVSDLELLERQRMKRLPPEVARQQKLKTYIKNLKEEIKRIEKHSNDLMRKDEVGAALRQRDVAKKFQEQINIYEKEIACITKQDVIHTVSTVLATTTITTGTTSTTTTQTTSVNSSTTTSLLTPSPSPSVFTQAKDGATFFVKNVELEGTIEASQTAAVYAEFLKDDGAADYLLGKPAKVVLGSCILAVGVPVTISTMCPPCAPFMMPALGVGMTYCSGAVPVAGASAVIENGAHLAGYETTITQTRRRAREAREARVVAEKPVYALSDEEYFSSLNNTPSDKLKEIKKECDSWQSTADYSPFPVDQYKAKHELRFSRLIDKELELRAANERRNDLVVSKKEQSTAVDHNLIPKPNQGCGSTEPVEPLQLPGKPGTPLIPEQNPGYPGVPLVPDKPIGGYALPVEKSEPLINVPVETDWRDNVLTKDNKNDTVPKVKQYDGPKYIRTEDWVESLPAEVKKHAIRTKEINKKKRVFQFEKEYGDIGKKDKVAVDSVHYDHLEVFDSTGTVWKFAANFDGTKNIEKTNQVKKPREIKS